MKSIINLIAFSIIIVLFASCEKESYDFNNTETITATPTSISDIKPNNAEAISTLETESNSRATKTLLFEQENTKGGGEWFTVYMLAENMNPDKMYTIEVNTLSGNADAHVYGFNGGFVHVNGSQAEGSEIDEAVVVKSDLTDDMTRVYFAAYTMEPSTFIVSVYEEDSSVIIDVPSIDSSDIQVNFNITKAQSNSNQGVQNDTAYALYDDIDVRISTSHDDLIQEIRLTRINLFNGAYGSGRTEFNAPFEWSNETFLTGGIMKFDLEAQIILKDGTSFKVRKEVNHKSGLHILQSQVDVKDLVVMSDIELDSVGIEFGTYEWDGVNEIFVSLSAEVIIAGPSFDFTADNTPYLQSLTTGIHNFKMTGYKNGKIRTQTTGSKYYQE